MKISPKSLPTRPAAYENTDGRPTWSPDSKMVASEKGRDVVVLSRDDHQVLNKIGPEGNWVHSPSWSPDGKRIAYGTYGRHRDYDTSSWAIYSSAPDGTDQKLLTVDAWEPEYSPDGKRIACQFQKGHHDDRIMVMDADGQNVKFVNKTGGFLQRDLSWSPGGHQIAYDTFFAGGYQTRVTDITGTKDRRLTDGEKGLYTDKNPEWAPDGKKILFERHSKRFPVNDLWTVDPVTRKEKLLVQGTHRHLDAAWSPDGSKIAFASNRDEDKRDLDIYVMDADGSNMTQVTDMKGHEHAVSWSPDGTALAFNRYDSQAEGEDRNDVHIVELPETLHG